MSIAAGIFLSMICACQSGWNGTVVMVSSLRRPATTAGESSPPLNMTFGRSSCAFLRSTETRDPKPTLKSGKRSRGTTTMVMMVRRARRASVSSLRYTIPISRAGILERLRGRIVRSDDLDEDLLEVAFVLLIPQFLEGAFSQQFSGLNNADHVAELLDLGHDVGGENDGFAAVAAFPNEGGNGARGHD